MKILSLDQLQQALAASKRPIIVEALPKRHFDAGHIPGAIQLNVSDVDTHAATLLPDPSAEIVVYCSNEVCSNSHQVAIALMARGYQNVAVFKAGKQAWQQSGLALEVLPS
jgi:rhodanese-related sulfurtransferase